MVAALRAPPPPDDGPLVLPPGIPLAPPTPLAVLPDATQASELEALSAAAEQASKRRRLEEHADADMKDGDGEGRSEDHPEDPDKL